MSVGTQDMGKDTPRWSAALPLAAGFLALVTLGAGLGVWGMQARISGAVVASGMIEVESNRQVVQHLEGGIVGEILVKDGDHVAAGEVLLRLDGTRPLSELGIVEGQLSEISARQSRLEAERDGIATISFPADLLAKAEASDEARRQVEGESALFNARAEALEQERELLHEQNRQIENRIAGILAQIEALRAQGAILDKQLADQQSLLAEKLTQSGQVLELERQAADIEGQLGRLEAEVAELRGQSAGNGIAALQLTTKRREEAVTTLRDLEFRQIELLERKTALTDTIARLEVRAPVSGVIYNTTVFAVQSVVRAAEPLMYVIPQDQPLVVACRIESINVDEVYLGQEAVLRFSAFDQRTMPELTGHIVQISADVLQDKTTGQNYYLARIEPSPEELAKLETHVLVPGMPVEVFIKTGDRTAFQYLTQPMMNFFNRAFRE
ncbi:MAG: HlyD family type I secretion periplasmic adaptor subunit [Paracoccaceae bacterium]